MKGWHWFEITYMLSVIRFLLKHRKQYDIVQCFGLYLFIPPALVMKYLFRKKVIARLECAGRFGDFWRIKQLRWGKLVRACSKRCDAIMYISQDIHEELIAHNYPREKLVHITNSVDSDQFNPADTTTARASKSICFVGRLEEQKGLEYLIRAMDIVREKEPGVRLIVVGDGALRSNLETLSAELKLQDHVFLVGATDDVLTYYQDAHVFVLPSISEGLPLSLLEALSCGLPVIATAIGGNREILDPHYAGETIPIAQFRIVERGLLVNPEDVEGLARAILRLLHDELLTNQLRERARTCVQENYGIDKVIGEYRALYSGLLDKKYL
jgi:glycosyltransferase involved in cell wall biosynthesis